MLMEALVNSNPTPQIESSGFICTATKAEENSVVAVIMMAFSTDPAARWLYPEPHQYLTHFPAFIKAFAGKAFECESVHYAEGFAGAALWLPPNIHSDEDALIRLFDETVSESKKEDLFGVFEQMGNYHPTEPHWYLPMIGVDSFHQGNGYGSALMRHALVQSDNDEKLAYLEFSNPRNVSLYERHGFEMLGTIQVGSSPPIFPMLRMPQKNSL
jgi:ribosomal protein S18 acetylase RimI-like enzyme